MQSVCRQVSISYKKILRQFSTDQRINKEVSGAAPSLCLIYPATDSNHLPNTWGLHIFPYHSAPARWLLLLREMFKKTGPKIYLAHFNAKHEALQKSVF